MRSVEVRNIRLKHFTFIIKEGAKLMFFTFQFTFVNNEKNLEEIQFCAKNKAEAMALFSHWRKTEGQIVGAVISVEVVYNQYDADEYGTRYGRPEDYYTKEEEQ